jgi:murein DD-endopeptidase MepM/ murein hydrolase activator NlpD
LPTFYEKCHSKSKKYHFYLRCRFDIYLFYCSSRGRLSKLSAIRLNIPLLLSANFAEIRPDHFHTGFDLRTQEKTGFKVFAAADGYVSRIKVSAFGFGNAVYIMHPNGYMTVYGHLEHFSDSIAAYVKQSQYEKQSFEVDLFPDARKFPVKQGTLIAWSGNSGSSGGPHLHFEIRDASAKAIRSIPLPS